MRADAIDTGVEYVLKDSDLLRANIDLDGNFSAINGAFLRVSGFCAAELAGAPFHTALHPDVPAAIRADLWRVLRNGRIWTGMLKQRCGNGDHYWIQATAAPVAADGIVSAYSFVGVKPVQARIYATEHAYAKAEHAGVSPDEPIYRRQRISGTRRDACSLRRRLSLIAAAQAGLVLIGAYSLHGGHTWFAAAAGAAWLHLGALTIGIAGRAAANT